MCTVHRFVTCQSNKQTRMLEQTNSSRVAVFESFLQEDGQLAIHAAVGVSERSPTRVQRVRVQRSLGRWRNRAECSRPQYTLSQHRIHLESSPFISTSSFMSTSTCNAGGRTASPILTFSIMTRDSKTDRREGQPRTIWYKVALHRHVAIPYNRTGNWNDTELAECLF